MSKKATVFTPEKQIEFLAQLANCGFLGRAARAIGVGRSTVFKHKRDDPIFAERYEEALADYTERMEEEADRRAYHGVLRPVFYQGQECGQIREFSDTLLIFRLKGLAPEKYADWKKQQITGDGGGPVQIEVVTGISRAPGDDESNG